MAPRHDAPSGLLAAPSAAERHPAPSSEPPALESTADHAIRASSVDPLSDVLRTVRLTGALYFMVEASPPWTIEMPDGAVLAAAILPRAQHLISYHIVTEGSCWGALVDGRPIRVETGDVLVIPRGDAYVLSMARSTRGGPAACEVLAFMKEIGEGRMPFTVVEDGGGAGRLGLVCGFLGCDIRPFNPLLATLPRLLHVQRSSPASGDLLGRLIELTVAESRERRAGGECVRLRLSELMFVEVVRRHLAALPAGQKGWLSGLRDETVGHAIACLHERPAAPWTLAALAKAVGSSRSVLADRFTHFVGHPPMQYLTRWRMQLAARLLADGRAKVAAVAEEVGYDSEAAFSRAFKKVAGVAPATWRQRHAAHATREKSPS